METDNIKKAEEALEVLKGIVPTFKDLLTFRGTAIAYPVGTEVFYSDKKKINWSYHYDVKTPIRELVANEGLIKRGYIQGLVIGIEQCIESNYNTKDHETLHVLYLTGHLDIINHTNFNDKHREEDLYLTREKAIEACAKRLKKAKNQYIRDEKSKKQDRKERLERELKTLK